MTNEEHEAFARKHLTMDLLSKPAGPGLKLAEVMADAIKDALLCGKAVIHVRVEDGLLTTRVESELHP